MSNRQIIPFKLTRQFHMTDMWKYVKYARPKMCVGGGGYFHILCN